MELTIEQVPVLVVPLGMTGLIFISQKHWMLKTTYTALVGSWYSSGTYLHKLCLSSVLSWKDKIGKQSNSRHNKTPQCTCYCIVQLRSWPCHILGGSSSRHSNWHLSKISMCCLLVWST